MRAILLQHRSAPVQFDPPPSDPREQEVMAPYEGPTPDQLLLLDTQDALERLASQIGWCRLARIVRHLAAINGESF